jgi:hypothetical protein
MAISYKHHLWNGTDGYKNLPDGVTSRIRVKKLDDGDEVKNLDHNLPLADLLAISDADLQTIIQGLVDREEQIDADKLAKSQIVIPPVDAAANTKVKKIKTEKKP